MRKYARFLLLHEESLELGNKVSVVRLHYFPETWMTSVRPPSSSLSCIAMVNSLMRPSSNSSRLTTGSVGKEPNGLPKAYGESLYEVSSRNLSFARSCGKLLREVVDDVIGGITAFARGMAEAAGAEVVFPIEDHVVVVIGTWPHWDRVEMQLVADLPGDDVICAGSIAAEAETAQNFAGGIIERKPASEDDDAADGFPDHRIVRGAERRGIPEYRIWIGGSAGREAVEALTRLRGRVNIRCRECVIGTAQCVRGTCL